MAASGGVGRGVLRPGFGRSPPFIMIGLLIITGICAFNYWNLSAQYNDLVKEITELQEHVQIVTLKRETAEKHVDALQQRLSEAGDHLGEVKVELEKKLKEEKRQEEEIRNLRNELKVKENTSNDEVVLLKKDLLNEKLNNTLLKEKETVLYSTIQDLKARVNALRAQHSREAIFKVPPIVHHHNEKTADDVPGQLKLLNVQSVKIHANGLKGITIHPGGPLVFVPHN